MARARRRPAKKHTQLLNLARPYYDRMFAEQGGGCAICGRPPKTRRLDIDHQHKEPMFIRGLLCARCNRAIPSWMDADWLRAAALYLDRGPVPWLIPIIAKGSS